MYMMWTCTVVQRPFRRNQETSLCDALWYLKNFEDAHWKRWFFQWQTSSWQILRLGIAPIVLWSVQLLNLGRDPVWRKAKEVRVNASCGTSWTRVTHDTRMYQVGRASWYATLHYTIFRGQGLKWTSASQVTLNHGPLIWAAKPWSHQAPFGIGRLCPSTLASGLRSEKPNPVDGSFGKNSEPHEKYLVCRTWLCSQPRRKAKQRI